MKRGWVSILVIVFCFIAGTVIPVYAMDNTKNEIESLKNYTVVSENRVKNLSSSMIHSLSESKAFQIVKTELINKEKAEAAKQEAQLATVNKEDSKPEGEKIIMEATAYSCNEGVTGGGNLTALGQDLQADPMAIAVDPTVIPLGTKLYVEGYGEAVASDTGGAIKGNIIDLHFTDVSECITWGRRQVEVTIIA
ncbi:3D domain-containing protein [Enterococcus sp. 5H]|uniref:3D domain-containing protein n=1 Tax=Enterococcus sp. 5H TaxID=1229490 RepID=UPI002302AF63|nr:3D domain-containing protein [Enterococcus sp. 5H]MDA9470866.1 Cell wall-binding protein [Enterococcus sp. 5H]